MKGIQSEKVSNGGYKYTQLLRSRIGEINCNMLILFKLCKYFRLTGESRKDIERINGITQLWRDMLTSERLIISKLVSFF